MHPTGSNQTAKSHPQVQEHNAKTKTATNKLLQQKRKGFTQSQDWRASLHATSPKDKKLDTRSHHQKIKSKDIQNKNIQWSSLC